MKTHYKFIIYFSITFFQINLVHAQNIETETFVAGDSALIARNLDLSDPTSTGIYGYGYIGLRGVSEGNTGVGVSGESTFGYGLHGKSTNDHGIKGESFMGNGVLGTSDVRSGVEGRSELSFGIVGTSESNHGGYFRAGINNNKADIILGGSNWFSGNDDGVIMSDPGLVGSDIFLVANDAIIMEIGNAFSENGTFEVWHDWSGNKLLTLNEAGNMWIKGTLNQGSDINRKHNITAIDTKDILHKIEGLPISEWQYLGEDVQHIGPMAQDFFSAFGLGIGNTSIASIDADGVSLAGIKALIAENKKLQKRIKDLEQAFGDLDQKVQEHISATQKDH